MNLQYPLAEIRLINSVVTAQARDMPSRTFLINQLVLILKQIPTTSADTVPLSVQFEQIQATARQQALQEM